MRVVASLFASVLLMADSAGASVQVDDNDKDVMAWVWWCNFTQPGITWPQFTSQLHNVTKTAGISSVAYLAYALQPDGTFGYYNKGPGQPCGEQMEQFGIAGLRAVGPEIRQYPVISIFPVLANSSTLRMMIENTTQRRYFISDAVTKLQRFGFDGYNIDTEVDENGGLIDVTLYKSFLVQFAKAVHDAGGTVSVDIDWCGNVAVHHADYMGMTCSDYSIGPVDEVVMMKSYTHNLTDFGDYVKYASKGLQKKLRVGIDHLLGLNSTTYIKSFFDELDSYNVDQAAIWFCPVLGCFTESLIESIQYWRRT